MKLCRFYKPADLKRLCALTVFLAWAWLMVVMPAQAGQGNAGFQVSLTIVARPPAPKVTRQVISSTSPRDPPQTMLKGQVVSEGQPDHQVIVVTTEY